jgi:hypothetical protein
VSFSQSLKALLPKRMGCYRGGTYLRNWVSLEKYWEKMRNLGMGVVWGMLFERIDCVINKVLFAGRRGIRDNLCRFGFV